jgi:hypothetical protein
MAKFEGSKADNKMDQKGAKKAGVSLKKFEGSKADEKMDRAGQKKLDRKSKK